MSGGGGGGVAGGGCGEPLAARPDELCPLRWGLDAFASSAAYCALRRAFSSAAVRILCGELGRAGVGLWVRVVAEATRVTERGGGLGATVDSALGGGWGGE